MERKRGRIVRFVLAPLMAVVAFACTQNEAVTEPIRIGSVLSLSGDLAEYGMRCREGVELALEEINAGGGVSGRPLQVIFEDGKGDPKEGVAAINKLINVDRVPVVIGGVSSSVTLAMEPIATRAKVFLFSPVSSSPKIPGKSPYLYSMWPPDLFEARELASLAKTKLGKSRVAILYVNNEYGLGLMEAFRQKAQDIGLALAAIEAYPLNSAEFRDFIPAIRRSQPDVIFLAGYHKEMAFAAKQLREAGLTQQILGDTDFEVDELLQIAGEAAEGAIYATPKYDPTTGGTAMKAFADRYRAKHGKNPSLFQANAYDLTHFVAQAFRENGITGDAVAKYVPSIRDYEGAAGRTSFTGAGEVLKEIEIKMVREGKFVRWQQ